MPGLAALRNLSGVLIAAANSAKRLRQPRERWLCWRSPYPDDRQIKAGEGVFGLRRAVQVTGARTVIMSLWSVEDQATRAWMRAPYEGRFQKKLSTANAVHQ